GTWTFDNRGHIIGNFIQLLVSEQDGSLVTNAISFTGKVSGDGQHLTLVASTSFGKVVYQGTPFVTVGGTKPSIDGPWTGFKFEGKQSFLEFFQLDVSPGNNVYPIINGFGPGYVFGGDAEEVCMVSSHNRIGFSVLETSGTNSVLRASIGTFKNNKTTLGGKT